MKFLLIVLTAVLAVSFSASGAPKKKAKNKGSRLRAGVMVPANREKKLFAGANASETTMNFDGAVEIASRVEPSREKALSKIEDQVGHLFGPLSAADYPAVPKGDQNITQVKIAKKASGLWEATYHYKGTVLIKNGPKDKYTITLPVNPDKIYEQSAVTRGGNVTYPCTDHHYDSQGDFWYFWNPEQSGCKLQEGVEYVKIEADIERISNTKETYPDYPRLADSNGVIRISILMGMDDTSSSKNPHQSRDINADNYRQVYSSLTNTGFKPAGSPWTADQIKDVVSTKKKFSQPFVEELEKTYKDGSKINKVSILLFFGPSGIDEDSTAFHYFYKDALENSSIMIYDGHSGLGGHLDPAAIEDEEGFKFKLSKSKYQIYFYNSCTSYTYYNSLYFDRKGGSKNLDIMLNGLATLFSVMHDTDMAVIKAIDNWATDKAVLSYQALAPKIDSDNLFAIAGDEDNPTDMN